MSIHRCFFLEIFISMVYNARERNIWACSAVGSALHSHCRGRRFESDQVHHEKSHFCPQTKVTFSMISVPSYFTRKYITGQRGISHRIGNISLKIHGFVI